jgi:hypothetical protein
VDPWFPQLVVRGIRGVVHIPAVGLATNNQNKRKSSPTPKDKRTEILNPLRGVFLEQKDKRTRMLERETEVEIPSATKSVQFVGLENMDSQSTRERRVIWKLNRAEREAFERFLGLFQPQMSESDLDEFDISEDEEDRLLDISYDFGTSENDKKDAEVAVFWCNTLQLKLYQNIIQALQTFETPNLTKKAVDESMRMLADHRGRTDVLRHIPCRCKKFDAQGVEFMFWDSVAQRLGVRYGCGAR